MIPEMVSTRTTKNIDELKRRWDPPTLSILGRRKLCSRLVQTFLGNPTLLYTGRLSALDKMAIMDLEICALRPDLAGNSSDVARLAIRRIQ